MAYNSRSAFCFPSAFSQHPLLQAALLLLSCTSSPTCLDPWVSTTCSSALPVALLAMDCWPQLTAVRASQLKSSLCSPSSPQHTATHKLPGNLVLSIENTMQMWSFAFKAYHFMCVKCPEILTLLTETALYLQYIWTC